MKETVFHALTNPWLWIALGFPFILGVLQLSSRSDAARSLLAAGVRALPFAGAAAIFVYLASAWAYSFSPIFRDHIEPNVSDVAFYLARGHELYHLPSSGECYSMLYGPNCYIFAAAMERALGASIVSSKISGAISATITVAAAVWALARLGTWRMALALGGVYAGFLLHFDYYSYCNRPDPMLAMLANLGILAATFGSVPGAVALGAAAGLAVGFKAHAPIYFLPAIALFRPWPPGWRPLAAAAAAGLAAAALPFVAYSNISFINYLNLLRAAGAHGFDREEFVLSAKLLGKMFLPLAILILGAQRGLGEGAGGTGPRKRFYLALACALAIAIPPAAKAGAGPHHFLPLVLAFFICAQWLLGGWPELAPQRPFSANLLLGALCAWTAWMLLVGFNIVRETPVAWKRKAREEGKAAADDLAGVIRDYGARYNVLMGVGGTETEYIQTYCRPGLVLAGMPIGIEPAAYMDYRRSGLDGPSLAQVEAAAGPKPLLWLIPRGGQPFALQTFYTPHVPLFTGAFRSNFAAAYAKASQSALFDIYTKGGTLEKKP